MTLDTHSTIWKQGPTRKPPKKEKLGISYEPNILTGKWASWPCFWRLPAARGDRGQRERRGKNGEAAAAASSALLPSPSIPPPPQPASPCALRVGVPTNLRAAGGATRFRLSARLAAWTPGERGAATRRRRAAATSTPSSGSRRSAPTPTSRSLTGSSPR